MDSQFMQMAAMRTAIDIRMECDDDRKAIEEACRRAAKGGSTDRKFYSLVIEAVIECGRVSFDDAMAIVRTYFHLPNGGAS